MSTKKSFSTETSERYARALFEVSKEGGELEKIEADIKNFQFLHDSSLELKSFIENPTYTIEVQNKILNLLSEKLSFSKNLKNFFFLLIKKRRIFFVKKIIISFLKLCSKKRGEIKASLVSSKRLSKEELNEISSQFSQSMGSKIKFDYSVDETLIVGVKIQLGSLMVDTSIKNKLKKYKQLMLEN